jgi:hypothetical protein
MRGWVLRGGVIRAGEDERLGIEGRCDQSGGEDERLGIEGRCDQSGGEDERLGTDRPCDQNYYCGSRCKLSSWEFFNVIGLP